MIFYDVDEIIDKYGQVVDKCNDKELKNVLIQCRYLHDYFERHFGDGHSSEIAHYHLHLAQEAISEYILDKSEC